MLPPALKGCPSASSSMAAFLLLAKAVLLLALFTDVSLARPNNFDEGLNKNFRPEDMVTLVRRHVNSAGEKSVLILVLSETSFFLRAGAKSKAKKGLLEWSLLLD